MHVVVYRRFFNACDHDAFRPTESVGLHYVETVLYFHSQHLIEVLANLFEVGKYLMEGEESAIDRGEDTA